MPFLTQKILLIEYRRNLSIGFLIEYQTLLQKKEVFTPKILKIG